MSAWSAGGSAVAAQHGFLCPSACHNRNICEALMGTCFASIPLPTTYICTKDKGPAVCRNNDVPQMQHQSDVITHNLRWATLQLHDSTTVCGLPAALCPATLFQQWHLFVIQFTITVPVQTCASAPQQNINQIKGRQPLRFPP